MQGLDRAQGFILGDDQAERDFGRALRDRDNVDARAAQRAKNAPCDPGRFPHPFAHDGDNGHR